MEPNTPSIPQRVTQATALQLGTLTLENIQLRERVTAAEAESLDLRIKLTELLDKYEPSTVDASAPAPAADGTVGTVSLGPTT